MVISLLYYLKGVSLRNSNLLSFTKSYHFVTCRSRRKMAPIYIRINQTASELMRPLTVSPYLSANGSKEILALPVILFLTRLTTSVHFLCSLKFSSQNRRLHSKSINHVMRLTSLFLTYLNSRGGGGLPYESDGDARRKIRIKPLKETNLSVAQALFEP